MVEEEMVKENKKGEAAAKPEEEDKPMHVVRTYIMVRGLELLIL